MTRSSPPQEQWLAVAPLCAVEDCCSRPNADDEMMSLGCRSGPERLLDVQSVIAAVLRIRCSRSGGHSRAGLQQHVQRVAPRLKDTAVKVADGSAREAFYHEQRGKLGLAPRFGYPFSLSRRIWRDRTFAAGRRWRAGRFAM